MHKVIVSNPTNRVVNSVRGFRGGGWNNVARFCLSAYRFKFGPEYRYGGRGFRIVKGNKSCIK